MNADLFHRFLTSVTIIWIAILASCNPREVPPLVTQMPSFQSSEIPEGQFLFVFVEDDDYTCLDDLCSCPISEAPAMPFKFQGDQLFLNPYWLNQIDPNSVTLEEIAASSMLYADYSQWDASLRLFSTFPIETLTNELLIVAVNSQGDIQLRAGTESIVVPVGSKYNAEETELKDEACKVLHQYSLTNYGFIQDTNVELFKIE